MLDLFGSGMPLAARFFIAFLVVLALIGVTAWLVRRFATNRLGNTAARGRQPRLAVIDATNVDARRRLVLIRRDNVEHLLMIGGPTDVVVEPNIVRAAAAAAREPLRAGAPDIVARPAPALETGWPLQPLTEPPAAAPAPSPPLAPTPVRPSRPNVTEEPWLAPEPGARPRPAEAFGGIAPDLVPPPPPRSEPPAPRVTAPPPPLEPPVPAAAQTDHNLAEMALQLEAALRRAPLPESRPPVSDAIAAQAAAPIPKPPKIPEPPPRAPLREFKPRVEAKPEPKVEPKFEPPVELKPEPKLEPKFEPKPEPKLEAWPKPEFKPEPKLEAKPEPKPEVRAEPKLEIKPEPAPASDKKTFDSLEEEMASLLGRPSGKS
ncbi:MAG TPA: flagellar biosynthetic protein FliO [Pseudolabrys sp.]|nr:flagellar biosynthetic protein FliO [Pseudolabrys sp.]